MVYLVGEGLGAVAVLGGCGGLNKACAVSAILVIGIIHGIDVNGQTAGVLGELGAA